MNCNYIQSELFTFIEQKNVHPEFSAIEKHLSDCSQCSEIYHILLKSDSIIHKMKIKDADSDFYRRIELKMKTQIVKNKKSSSFNYFRIAAVSLILLSTISAGVLIGYLSSNQLINTEKIVEDFNNQKDTEANLFADNSFTLIDNSN